MLNKLRKSKSDGFTIIEVMIVLAIAALILLIVLLAVPALQRSSRNNQRKNDISAISSSLATFVSDNAGQSPVGLGKNANTSLLDLCSAVGSTKSGQTACSGTGTVESAKIGFYDETKNIFYNTTATSATLFTPTVAAPGTESTTTISTESVIVATKENCNSNGSGVGTYGTRNIAIFYVVETGSGNGSLQCIEP